MEFNFPDVGEGIHEGKLVSWKVKEGDTVHEDQVLCEVETDKSVVEIPSPFAGTIKTLHHKEGDVLHVGDPLVSYDSTGSTPAAPAATTNPAPEKQPEEKKPETPAQNQQPVPQAPLPLPPSQPAPKPEAQQPMPKAAQGPVASSGSRILATPSTRNFARERGVDLHTITGTGPAGRITKQDVEAATGTAPAQATKQTPQQQTQATPAQAKSSPSTSSQSSTSSSASIESVTSAKPGEEIAYAGMRKAVGEHMQATTTIPSVTVFSRADVTAFVELREHLKKKAEKMGVKLTYLPLFMKAVTAALSLHPVLNAHFTPQAIKTFSDIHLGVAVDTPRGLVVPVVEHVEKKSVMTITQELNTIIPLARDAKLKKEQLSGSTFSITSIGAMRVEEFTPILNAPEVGILGIGAIRDEPWVVDGTVTARKVVALSLTFDHRALDGAEAARFMTDLVNILEDPELLILEGM